MTDASKLNTEQRAGKPVFDQQCYEIKIPSDGLIRR